MPDLPDFPINPVSETDTTITLGWGTPPPATDGYVFRSTKKQSRTFDPNRRTVRFEKGTDPYTIEPVTIVPIARGTWPKVGPPIETGTYVAAWEITLQPEQRDPSSGPGNRYTFGWVKSRRPVPPGVGGPGWQDEGLIELSDFPDWFCMIESKRFGVGFPGRITNFHLVGGDAVHNGVSPLSLDWHRGRMSDSPPDIPPSSLVIVGQAEGDGSDNRQHWLVATEQEVRAYSDKTWTFRWAIRWRRDRSGHVNLQVLHDGVPWRTVDVPGIRTIYVEQKPRLYAWLGAYESEGLSSPAVVKQTLDYRGRSFAECIADKPVLGSDIHSIPTGGYPASSVVASGQIPIYP